MRQSFSMIVLLSAIIGVATIGVARAGCESDLIVLEEAYKASNLTTTGRAALDDAKTKAVSALKKDEDTACHKAVAEGMTQAGLTMK